MNKKRLLLALVLGIVLMLLCASALAADSPLTYKGTLSTYKFTGPQTVTVSITVSNSGEGDLPGPVTLYYPSGKQVEEFGSPTLNVGASAYWSGPWTVTQKELEEGKVVFTVRYSIYDDDGNLQNKGNRISFPIQYAGAEPELTVNRTFLPSAAQKGQEVSVIYEIVNTGTADVNSVSIKENSAIASEPAEIASIPAGESRKHVFTVKMGTKDLTSAATITYKAGGKTYNTVVEAAVIKYSKVDLSATLTADKKGGAPGETVKLTLKLKNSGKTDITNVTATDEKYGTLFSTDTVKAGDTVTLEKEMTITESAELLLVVTGENGTETPVETATGRINIVATDPAKQIVLSVEASADRNEVYVIPGGIVRFTITVHNESAVDVSNIVVKAVDREVYRFDSIPAGESRSVSRDMEISMGGSFQFTANAKDELGQTMTFASNIVPVSYAPPTPVPTAAPMVTPPAPETLPMPTKQIVEPWKYGNYFTIAGLVFLGIAVILLPLLLIGAIRRAHSKSQSKKDAIDQLEGANYRDYSLAPKGRKRSEIMSGEEEQKEEAAAPQDQKENTAQNSELMTETLKRLYTEPAEAAENAAEAAETAVEETAGSATEAAEEAAETAAEAAEEAAAGADEATTEIRQQAETTQEVSRRRRAGKK